jgi:hypothetical protein
MLDKGLYRCSPDMIFKVIGRLNVDYLLKGNQRLALSEIIDGRAEPKTVEQGHLCKTLQALSTHLIGIWN